MEVEHLALLPHSTVTGVSGVRDKNAIAEVFLLCQKDAEACISVSWTAVLEYHLCLCLPRKFSKMSKTMAPWIDRV